MKAVTILLLSIIINLNLSSQDYDIKPKDSVTTYEIYNYKVETINNSSEKHIQKDYYGISFTELKNISVIENRAIKNRISYYQNGNMKSIGRLVDSRYYYYSFYQNGTLKSIGQYRTFYCDTIYGSDDCDTLLTFFKDDKTSTGLSIICNGMVKERTGTWFYFKENGEFYRKEEY